MIYFVQPIDGGPIKIGTTIRLTERFGQLEKDWGAPLKILAVMDGRFSTENELHRQFNHLRLRGEWFSPSEELLSFIESTGRSWDGSDDVPVVGVKIDVNVIRQARIIAAIRDVTIAEYLSVLLRPLVERDYKEALSREAGARPPKR